MSTAIAKMAAGGSLRAIYPQNVEEAYRFSKMAFQAGVLVPLEKGYGNKKVTEEEQATLARGTMLILQGMEVGVPPMQSIQLLALIKGRITAHSEAVPGILLAHGCKIKTWWTGTEMADDWTCHKELTRPNGDVYYGSYSVMDAKRAALWDQKPTKPGWNGNPDKPNDSAWFRNPKRMLNARALGNVGKDGASDFLKGIAIREEMEDLEAQMRDITPVAQPIIEAPEIPDIDQTPPAEAAAPDAPDVPDVDQDPPIADPESFLAKLREDIGLCESAEEADEIREHNASMLDRLSPADRVRAEAILNGEVE